MKKVTIGLTPSLIITTLYLFVQQLGVNNALKKNKIDWFMMNMPSWLKFIIHFELELELISSIMAYYSWDRWMDGWMINGINDGRTDRWQGGMDGSREGGMIEERREQGRGLTSVVTELAVTNYDH